MKRQVAAYIIEKLKEAGVKRIWGVTGDALNAFADAVQKTEGMEWMSVRHEENGAFACYGSAAVTEELAVCAGTVGPGALHLINGLYNAKRERVPVLAITGQVPLIKQGTSYFQEVDLKKMFDDVCDFQAIIRSAEQVPRLLTRAMQIALWNRTVVRLEIPQDVGEADIEDIHFDHPIVHSQSKVVCPESDIRRAVEILEKHDKIAILAGAGARNAREEVIALAEKLKAPIVHTLKSADVFDDEIPQVVGISGLIGNHPGYSAIMHSGALLMVGTDFPYSNFIPDDNDIIQIDIRPETLGNRASITHGIMGDAADTVARITAAVASKQDSKFLDDHVKSHGKWREKMTEQSALENDAEPLLPSLFASELNRQASNDAIFALDVGESTVWGARYLVYNHQRRLIGSFNHGSMAVALPACLGAQAAMPGRQVWALVGDGGFVMGMQDLVTAVRYELPVNILIFNNSEYGFVKMESEVAGYPLADEALRLQNPDFVAYAKACGADGVRVEHARDIPAAISQAIASPKPFIIDAVVTAGSLTLPPKIKLEQAYGFTKSKVKEAILSLKGEKGQWENIMSEIKAYFAAR